MNNPSAIRSLALAVSLTVATFALAAEIVAIKKPTDKAAASAYSAFRAVYTPNFCHLTAGAYRVSGRKPTDTAAVVAANAARQFSSDAKKLTSIRQLKTAADIAVAVKEIASHSSINGDELAKKLSAPLVGGKLAVYFGETTNGARVTLEGRFIAVIDDVNGEVTILGQGDAFPEDRCDG